MIPAHDWGGRWARIGARPLLVGRSGWAILLSQPSHDVAPQDMASTGAAAMLVEAVPDDARTMSAGGLAEALRAAMGETCDLCGDEGERACLCCRGTTTLACRDAACTEEHDCETCAAGGRVRCPCCPAADDVAVLRGARFAARMMLPLRRLLALAGADAPVSVWTATCVPMADGTGPATVLVVDLADARYALTERRPGEHDVLHEVPL